MKPSTTDKGDHQKTKYFTGGSGKSYGVATKILRTPQAINNDRSLSYGNYTNCKLFLRNPSNQK